MKTARRLFIALALSAIGVPFAAHAQDANSSQKKSPTVWVDPKTGSLIGGGYAETGQTNIQARTLSHESAAFRGAINTLDAQGMRTVRGVGMVPTAVSAQTKVPVRTLVEQQSQTGLSYGELLIANSLAEGSGKSLDAIVAMRKSSSSWEALSKKLKINSKSIVARANAATNAIQYAEARSNRRRDQNMRDNGYELRKAQNPSVIPRAYATNPGG